MPKQYSRDFRERAVRLVIETRLDQTIRRSGQRSDRWQPGFVLDLKRFANVSAKQKSRWASPGCE